MKLRDFFEGRNDLFPREAIVEYVRRAPEFDPTEETLEDAEALLLFSTSRQHTWLVTTELRLYCILDDKAKREPELRWALPKSVLVDGSRFILPIETRDHSDRTGLINLGPNHKDWYFSKPLFANRDVKGAVAEMVSKKMIV